MAAGFIPFNVTWPSSRWDHALVRRPIHCSAAEHVKTRTDQSDVTELNWHGLIFDERTNEQAVMRYSRHRPTASVVSVTAWLRLRTRQPITSGLASP